MAQNSCSWAAFSEKVVRQLKTARKSLVPRELSKRFRYASQHLPAYYRSAVTALNEELQPERNFRMPLDTMLEQRRFMRGLVRLLLDEGYRDDSWIIDKLAD